MYEYYQHQGRQFAQCRPNDYTSCKQVLHYLVRRLLEFQLQHNRYYLLLRCMICRAIGYCRCLLADYSISRNGLCTTIIGYEFISSFWLQKIGTRHQSSSDKKLERPADSAKNKASIKVPTREETVIHLINMRLVQLASIISTANRFPYYQSHSYALHSANQCKKCSNNFPAGCPLLNTAAQHYHEWNKCHALQHHSKAHQKSYRAPDATEIPVGHTDIVCWIFFATSCCRRTTAVEAIRIMDWCTRCLVRLAWKVDRNWWRTLDRSQLIQRGITTLAIVMAIARILLARVDVWRKHRHTGQKHSQSSAINAFSRHLFPVPNPLTLSSSSGLGIYRSWAVVAWRLWGRDKSASRFKLGIVAAFWSPGRIATSMISVPDFAWLWAYVKRALQSTNAQMSLKGNWRCWSKLYFRWYRLYATRWRQCEK